MIAGLLKQFINSTIGTANMKPLDQLMGVKSVQRGTYTGSGGTVTINAVNMNKTLVLSVSKGSAGTVATNSFLYEVAAGNAAAAAITLQTAGSTIALHGGTTDLFVKEYSATLTNSTTLTCDGPCQWQVVEYN